MADFRYFRTEATVPPVYFRVDPDKGNDVRVSQDGLWVRPPDGTRPVAPVNLTVFDLVSAQVMGATLEIPVDEVPCHLCMVAAGTVPREVVHEWPDALVIVPRSPCEPGHRLIVPKRHVRDALEDEALTVRMFARAVEFAGLRGAPLNIATSVGKDATQTESHLHIHVGLLPLMWGGRS